MQATKDTEVEIRGRLSADKLVRIKEFSKSWKGSGHFNRYLVNFTTPEMVESRLDVRGRVTNGVPELVVKQGEWGGGARVETTVKCQEGQFLNLISALVAMGYVSGIGCHRIIDRYMIGEIELSLVEVPGYAHFYEAELMTSREDAESAEHSLRGWAVENGLPIFSKDEFLAFVAELDAHANDALEFTSEKSWELLRKRIGM